MVALLLAIGSLPAQRPPSATASPLSIAADSSGRASLHDRAVALKQLGAACPRSALPTLTELARPYRRDWVIWHGALTALASCPLEQLAPFWREMITFPRRPVREVAIVGLLRTGSPGDLELVREATHRETDTLIVRLAARADSVLKLPIASRAGVLPR